MSILVELDMISQKYIWINPWKQQNNPLPEILEHSYYAASNARNGEFCPPY